MKYTENVHLAEMPVKAAGSAFSWCQTPSGINISVAVKQGGRQVALQVMRDGWEIACVDFEGNISVNTSNPKELVAAVYVMAHAFKGTDVPSFLDKPMPQISDLKLD